MERVKRSCLPVLQDPECLLALTCLLRPTHLLLYSFLITFTMKVMFFSHGYTYPLLIYTQRRSCLCICHLCLLVDITFTEYDEPTITLLLSEEKNFYPQDT